MGGWMDGWMDGCLDGWMKGLVRALSSTYANISRSLTGTGCAALRDKLSPFRAEMKAPPSTTAASTPCRFALWVCTTAERGYALEAWRVLGTL